LQGLPLLLTDDAEKNIALKDCKILKSKWPEKIKQVRELALPLFPRQLLKNDEDYLLHIDRLVDDSWPDSAGQFILTLEEIYSTVHKQKSLRNLTQRISSTEDFCISYLQSVLNFLTQNETNWSDKLSK
jgi:hypothetical protein